MPLDLNKCEVLPANFHGTPFDYRLNLQVQVLENGCIQFLGWVNEKGYGRIRYMGRKELVHRAVYKHYVGPLDDDILLLHSCDYSSCCNPEHLFPGTALDNKWDCINKGRSVNPPNRWEMYRYA